MSADSYWAPNFTLLATATTGTCLFSNITVIPLSNFFPAGASVPNEKLIQNDYIKIKRDIKIKGKTDSTIILFDNFYLELKVG